MLLEALMDGGAVTVNGTVYLHTWLPAMPTRRILVSSRSSHVANRHSSDVAVVPSFRGLTPASAPTPAPTIAPASAPTPSCSCLPGCLTSYRPHGRWSAPNRRIELARVVVDEVVSVAPCCSVDGSAALLQPPEIDIDVERGLRVVLVHLWDFEAKLRDHLADEMEVMGWGR